MKYTINELVNSKGVSQPVREALLQMEAELDATNRQVEILSDALAESRRERGRVGLTDEKIYKMASSATDAHGFSEIAFARAIEAAHGIKGGA